MHLALSNKPVLTVIAVIAWLLSAHAQINGYAKVTAITSNSILTCSNVNQTYGSFAAGQNVIIMQMQDATYGTTNNSTFGSLSSLANSGLYEVATILAKNGSSTSMTLSSNLVNTYDAGASLQVITYPDLGTNFSTTSNITGVAWNGNVGGVIAFSVTGNLILNHNINANSIGFRGGAKAGQDGGSCETSTWRVATGDAKYADKGEGIGYETSTNHAAGRAKLVNAGGGGIVHNGGGGGGGNYTAGGDGYFGYDGSGYCSATTNAGGQGGLAVTSSASRVYMGGGGGGGQENNGVGTNGGIGGGIILIKCDTIVAQGSCSAKSITANGETAANGGNDGCGGGGAGGSIVLDIKGMRIKTGCPLTVSANGGNGGSVNNGGSHGAGGGGGQGAIYMRATSPITNVTFATNNGAGGNANNGGSPPTGGSGGGTAGSGVNTGQTAIPLPIDLLYFKIANSDLKTNTLEWATATEKNNARFLLLHSEDAESWNLIYTCDGQGNSSKVAKYNFEHTSVNPGNHYYKLLQQDFDGTTKQAGIVFKTVAMDAEVPVCAPNPTADILTIYKAAAILNQSFFLCRYDGSSQQVVPWISNKQSLVFDFSEIPPGAYILRTSGYAFKVNIVR